MIRKQYLFNSKQLKISSKLNNLLSQENNLIDRNCIICNSYNYQHISNTDRYGIKYFTGICKDCGLLQQYKYPNNDFVNMFYEKYYNDLYSFFKSPEDRFNSRFKSAQYKYDIIKKYLKNNIKNSVLEIGCGSGGILSFFQTKNYEVYGLDYQNDHLDYAKKKNITTFSNYKKINRKFDLIILSHVLEHLVSVDDVLTKCKNLLNDKGIIYIEVPSLESISEHYHYEIKNFLHIAHVTHFTKKTFMNLINLKGFKIKYINSKIHAVIEPYNSENRIINNYNDTKKILRKNKILKLIFLPFLDIFKIIKKIIKILIYK